ncbi:CidA/LrgA family protein [Puteibacter caeruleilacunae]|nr:CidA/LrgA family protein [Puteibacter caeruleilacunae]
MIRQAAIIFGCLAIGELIVYVTHVKLPSCIIGMLLLTFFLKMKWIKVSWVKDISKFFMKTLPFYFVPAGVAVMLYFDLILSSLWSILIAALGSTVVVLVVTGWVHQQMRSRSKKEVKTKNVAV